MTAWRAVDTVANMTTPALLDALKVTSGKEKRFLLWCVYRLGLRPLEQGEEPSPEELKREFGWSRDLPYQRIAEGCIEVAAGRNEAEMKRLAEWASSLRAKY